MHAMCTTCHCCTVDAAGQCRGGCETYEHPEVIACHVCQGSGRLMRYDGCYRLCAVCEGKGVVATI
jgi:hypothetical protein